MAIYDTSAAEVIRAQVERTSVAAATSSTRLLPPNNKRVGITILNLSDSSMLIDYTAFLSETDYMLELKPGGYYEAPFNTGDELYAIWRGSSPQGKALIREFVEP
jgi:hypothetical protein